MQRCFSENTQYCRVWVIPKESNGSSVMLKFEDAHRFDRHNLSADPLGDYSMDFSLLTWLEVVYSF